MSSNREFYVSVDLYIPGKAGSSLRKPSTQAKKSTDKRDIPKFPPALSELGVQKRVREKASWLSLGRQSPAGGQWRPATCKLVEEEGACTLNIYMDETILYRSVHVYTLNHTDIRPIHRSLFDNPDCIGIFYGGQQLQGAPTAEPIYIHFADTDAMNMWIALLRSYAVPEVYGSRLSPEDGGLYRMWRQVKLHILQGRNLGTPRLTIEEPANVDSDARQDSDAVDIDVYCEIYINGVLCGRTTVKKGVGSPDWQEHFDFSDLPPFENLEIVVWREKKMMKPAIVGSVLIVLVNFRRGEWVEGWFPILQGSSNAITQLQAGEMRLKVQVDEEIILPYESYSSLLQTFNSRNTLDWIIDFETNLKLKSVSNHIISVGIAQNILVEHIMKLADREVDGSPTSHNTLFRGNTVLTKTIEKFMSWCGMPFLEASVGSAIRRLCSDKVAIEVDPSRNSKGAKSVEKSVDLLVYWCQEFWSGIYDARRQCPPEMRRLFAHIRKLVEKRYTVDNDQHRGLPWQSVSAFCFLRFMVPAILNPHAFGLWAGLPDMKVLRSLTLIAKVIQNLANLNASVQKEAYMGGVKEFLVSRLQGMMDYILVVSTPDIDGSSSTPASLSAHERLKVMSVLRQRGNALPALYREAIPFLPHLVDMPKHLAVITSLVVRYSRMRGPGADIEEQDHFNLFCAQCVDIEEQALHRVSQLATSPRRRIISNSNDSPRDTLAASSLADGDLTSASGRGRKRLLRPRTAPALHSREPSPGPGTPESPRTAPTQHASRETMGSSASSENDHLQARHRPTRGLFSRHPRSNSTDSALLAKIVSQGSKARIVETRLHSTSGEEES